MATLERPDYLGSVQTADNPAGFSKLWFSREGRHSHAVVVRAVPSGFILCLPFGAIGEEELDQATADGYAGELGPWTSTNVTATSVHGRDQESSPLPLGRLPGDGVWLPLDRRPQHGACRRNPHLWGGPFAVCVAFSHQPPGGPRELPEWRRAGRTSGCIFQEAEVVTEGRATQDLLHQLLEQSTSQASLLEKMQQKLVKMDSLEARLSHLETSESSARAPARPASTSVEGAPAWAPQLFGEGAQAKLDADQVKQLLELAGRGPRNLGDVGAAHAAVLPKASASFLGASAKTRPAPIPQLPAQLEGDEEDGDIPGTGADADANTLARILVQQTQILTQLASSSKKSSDPLQSLLGGGGGGADEAKVPGVRGMAARQLLREQFAAHPERVVAKVRERLALARRKSSAAELEPRDMYLHFQETVPLGTFKTLTYFSFLMAEMWEAAERKQGAELMALLSLGLVFAEQVANEQGHTRLGWLLTARPDPAKAGAPTGCWQIPGGSRLSWPIDEMPI